MRPSAPASMADPYLPEAVLLNAALCGYSLASDRADRWARHSSASPERLGAA